MADTTPTVFENEPTTALRADEIAALTDNELLDFCEIHCWTPEARFHRSTVGRLFAMTGSTIRAADMPEWITGRPAIMNVLIRVARNSVRMRRRAAAVEVAPRQAAP